jgi:hypothetical protein
VRVLASAFLAVTPLNRLEEPRSQRRTPASTTELQPCPYRRLCAFAFFTQTGHAFAAFLT